MHHLSHHIVPMQKLLNGFALVHPDLRLVSWRVPFKRGLQVLRDADVVNNEARGLVLKHTVYARDGLHQPVPTHRLIHVHRVHAGRVKARQPHVSHEHNLELVLWVFGAACDEIATGLAAFQVLLPIVWVTRAAGHNDLHNAFLRVFRMPVWPNPSKLVVKLHTNTTAVLTPKPPLAT